MEVKENSDSIDIDSLAWGSAAKDACCKVYGNLDKQPMTFAMKVEIANIMRKFALEQIAREDMKAELDKVQEHYKEGD